MGRGAAQGGRVLAWDGFGNVGLREFSREIELELISIDA